MKVFVIPTSYPNPDNPVANSFIKEQVYYLSSNSCKIIVLNVQKQPTRDLLKIIDKGINVTNENGVIVYRKKVKTFFEKKFKSINQALFDRAMSELYKIAVEEHGYPDVIYAHFYRAAYSSLRLIGNKKIPIVVMEHSGDLMSDCITNNDCRILSTAVNNSDYYIATTEKLRDRIIHHTGTNKRIEVIPNIIDNEFCFYPPTEDPFTFLSVSRLEFDKRLDLLINAFCDVFSSDDSVNLLIGGAGSELSNLKRIVNEKGRTNQISFLGQLSRKEVLNRMIHCSCFALPSRHETFGLVWREALCVGRPVITTNHGGFSKNDWDDNYGIMIPVDDYNALKNALKYMRDNYNSYDLNYISSSNRRLYSADAISERIIALFKRSIGENE